MTLDSRQAEVYERYHERVFGYLLGRVRNRADAEDITSEVFLKLLDAADAFDPERPGANSYIFRVVQTTLMDHYRKNRFVCVPLDEVAETLGGAEEPDEQLCALDRALEKLPQREAEIVMLHYYYGLGHREIAEKMHLSYANVRQLCHVALGKLRRELEA